MKTSGSKTTNVQSNRRTVSVIIPTLGRESIKHCLDAIQRQTIPPDELLIIKDTERLGIGITRNKGIAQSTGDLIAFTDDDCVPPDNWIENLIAIMDQFNADVTGGTMRETDSFLDAIRKRHPYPTTVQEDETGIVGNGANIIYKRTVLEECHKRDGYIFYKHSGEDIDLIWRLQQRGAKVIYTPNAVLHLRKITYKAYLSRQFTRGTGIAGLYRSYRKTKGGFVAQPSLLWGHGKNGRNANWIKVISLKILGPFDVASFHSFRDFLIFWLGEKIQGVGFLWGMVFNDRS